MKILIADDERLLAMYLERSLAGDGHQVDIANNGLAAYKQATDNAYDVIVLDILMPELTGIEVCTDLRNDGVATPIIMLSSQTSEWTVSADCKVAPTTTW